MDTHGILIVSRSALGSLNSKQVLFPKWKSIPLTDNVTLDPDRIHVIHLIITKIFLRAHAGLGLNLRRAFSNATAWNNLF